MAFSLRYRQIHLDFHTSPLIPDVGARFDPDQFGDTLARADVDSITVFARCHHGMLYYPSRINPERIHPNLKRPNLLGDQIAACHARGIRAPIYTTVQWDDFTAKEHPEWLCRDADGAQIGQKPFEPGFYAKLCVNTGYRDFLKDHLRELLETFDCDGFFLDIVQPTPCACERCIAGMREAGLDPADPQARERYGQQVIDEFKADITAFIRQYNPTCSIFYNKGHVGPHHRPALDAYTHFELESLPSGGWGYMDFPVTMRYARTLGLDCLSHTGKFHTSWGDFHSFKNQAALEYECLNMLALNAKCEIGDQLDPSGVLSEAVYDLVGSVYHQVKALEPWCEGAQARAEIGLFTPEEYRGPVKDGWEGPLPPSVRGATRMLEEAGYQFDILDSLSDLSGYKLLILPDDYPASPELAEKLAAFARAGGALLAACKGGLCGADFIPELGVHRVGDAPYNHDFLLPRGEIGKGLPETEHVMYLPGQQVALAEGTQELIPTIVPYFNRTWEHFCSHRHTPSSGQYGYPGVTRRGNAVYFMHPVFTQYDDNGANWCKRLVLNALNLLLPARVIRHDGPSTLRVTVNRQQAQRRDVIHLLHYVPERRTQTIDIIEESIPLADLTFTLAADAPVARVTLAPQGDALPFTQQGDEVTFTLPRLPGHQVIAVEYA
ncbi:MAG: beta-galactosidase trimerization domain-containing protein [Christensenellales bacterium]|jgi:hypothetical protein